MVRTALITATLAAGLMAAPMANAQPKFCDSPQHNIYIHACASGDGGLGPMMGYQDSSGKPHFMRQKDYDKMVAENKRKHPH
jgi:hypothetical protein